MSGLSASDILKLKKLTAEDYRKIRSAYRQWIKNLQIIPTTICFALLIIALTITPNAQGHVKTIAITVAVIAGGTLLKREGHADGYIDGYQEGFGEGIDRVLGLTDDDLEFIRKIEVDAEIKKNSGPGTK